MITDPPNFVLIGLGIALLAMFTVSFYLLATRDRSIRRHAPVARSPALDTSVPGSADADEFDGQGVVPAHSRPLDRSNPHDLTWEHPMCRPKACGVH